MDDRQAKEHELVVEALLSIMNRDIDRTGDLIDALEEVQMDCLPEEGKWRIGFAGKPRKINVTVVCYDCGEVVTSTGISFRPPGELGVTDEEFVLLMHQGTCPHWKWRLKRRYNRHIRTPIVRFRHPHLRGK